MIHKFEKLVSVGKFRNYQAAGQVNFNKLTLVYADNGSGKTTLASVLRSLTLNNPEIVKKRISTNSSVPQAAQIVQKDSTNNYINHTLRNTGWSNPFPNIEIFDIHFVNENIYSGFDFSEDHKRQLHEFVIGAQGVAIKQQIEQNKTAKTISRQRIETIVNEIVQKVGNGLLPSGVQEFLYLKAIDHPDIDGRLSLAQNAFESAKASAVIKQLPGFTPISIPFSNIDFAAINFDLQATFETIQNEALQSVYDVHCGELLTHGITNPQSWLRMGNSYLHSKRNANPAPNFECPFCKQAVHSEIEILKAYSLRFNEEFNNLIGRLQNHLASLQEFNIGIIYQVINTYIQSNNQKIENWSTHSLSASPPVFNDIEIETRLRDKVNALIESIQLKIQNPSVANPITTSIDFERALRTIQEAVNSYNQLINEYNRAIDTFKSTIPTEASAQYELHIANRIKLRFTQEIESLCIQLNSEKQNLENLETVYTTLTQQERNTANTFFIQYKDRVNYYLHNVFKTPFLINNVAHIAPQGRSAQSKLGYKLTVDNNDISFNPSHSTNAKDCLSEGDKSTLALAFFLAKLDIDPGTSDKVIVIDDPLSSFDSNRRSYTVHLIKDLLSKVKQLIVLSHNEFFLADIYKNTSGAERKTLRILQNYSTNSSSIEDLDLSKMVEHEYFRHIAELQAFLSYPDIAKKDLVLGLIRNILEAHIRFKFYRQLSGIPENRRTFGRLIDELENLNVQLRENTQRANIISQLRLLNSISCKPHHGEGTPDYSTLGVDPSTITVTELAALVNDVFDLIDNKL